MLKPIGDRLLVRRIKEEQKKAGSIYIPESQNKETVECEVISKGNGFYVGGKLIEIDLKVGDSILINPLSLISVDDTKTETERNYLCRYMDVLAVKQADGE